MNFHDWPYSGKINYQPLKKIIKANKAKLKDNRYTRYFQAIQTTKKLANKINKNLSKKDLKDIIQFKNNHVSIGQNITISKLDRMILKKAIEAMVPWRKGPFEIFGEHIDTEWRSDLKWERVKKHAGSLQGKVILDIGCNNGYYLYHIAKQNPKYLLGIDPVIPYYQQFKLLEQFCPLPNTNFELLGIQDLIHFEKVFDVVFCMGIIYHHPNPIEILKMIYNSMRPGGLLIIESQGIKTDGSFLLFPQNRYLKMPGHWFIPSREALQNMIRRSGFQYIDTFLELKLDDQEQRRTTHAPFDSLMDGLDRNDPNITVEGYPAPWRFYLKARKARVRR